MPDRKEQGSPSSAATEEPKDDPKNQETAREPEIVEPEEAQSKELKEEELLAEKHRIGLIDKLQTRSPESWQSLLEERQKLLDYFRDVSIRKTVPTDWTLFRDQEGTVVAQPRDSGCTSMRKWLGITVFNYRPKDERNEAQPAITREKVRPKKGDGYDVTIVTMIADGYCHVTGETIEDVRFSVRSDMPFTGRKLEATGEALLQDLIAACRTGLDSKVTRVLADVRKVPDHVLKEKGIDTERCYKGHGYGTSKDRGASKVAEEGVKEGAQKLRDEILRRTGGDKEAARDVLRDITKNPEKNFGGFKSTDQFTKQWQLDRAWERVRTHEMFGDEGSGS